MLEPRWTVIRWAIVMVKPRNVPPVHDTQPQQLNPQLCNHLTHSMPSYICSSCLLAAGAGGQPVAGPSECSEPGTCSIRLHCLASERHSSGPKHHVCSLSQSGPCGYRRYVVEFDARALGHQNGQTKAHSTCSDSAVSAVTLSSGTT